ncbi:MAG: Txe/YoeB family addiction module toxin [Spirochaetaceae bacterium]|jgi:toxin YoeB|nr:Txe/YoeB family addiction module toxin [Spirochaetaceae bacterium]
MDKVSFTNTALAHYIGWQDEDRKTLRKINKLIQDIQRNGFLKGIGKPEALKHQKAFSREIDEQNRLVYTGDENQNLEIISCKGHYDD